MPQSARRGRKRWSCPVTWRQLCDHPSSAPIFAWCISVVKYVWIIYFLFPHPANCTLRWASSCFGRAVTFNPWRANTKVVDVRNASSPYTWGVLQNFGKFGGSRLCDESLVQLRGQGVAINGFVCFPSWCGPSSFPLFCRMPSWVIVRAEQEMGHRRKVLVTLLLPVHDRSHMEKCAFRPVHCLNAKRGCQEDDDKGMWFFHEMGWTGEEATPRNLIT